ncbi:MAG: hypothetical protein RJA11_1463 [Bacteroidota bacterium]
MDRYARERLRSQNEHRISDKPARGFQHEIIHLPKMRAQDIEVLAPCWPIHPNNHLWGATAMCVSELIGLYTDFMHENE